MEIAHPSPQPGSYANVDSGVGQDVIRYIWDSNDNKYVQQQGESTAETPASIKTKYESNPDTNAFTDSEQSKLGSIESGAEVNQSDSEIKTQYEANADTNAFTDAEQSKLSGIEANANNYTLPSTVIQSADSTVLQVIALTQAAYDAIPTKSATTQYLITDAV